MDPYAGDAATPYTQHQYAYGLSDPVSNTDPSGRCNPSLDPDCTPNGRSAGDYRPRPPAPPCRSDDGVSGCTPAPHAPRDTPLDNHECVGDPEAIELRLPLAGGGTAPVCLDGPDTLLARRRTPKPPRLLGITLNPDGTFSLCPSQSNAESDDDSLEEDSVTPPASPSKPPLSKDPHSQYSFKEDPHMQEGHLKLVIGDGPKGEVRIFGTFSQEGDTLYIREAHIEGGGPNTVGPGTIKAYAREYGRQQHVEWVIIEGAGRTTGARPGHTPKPMIVKVN